MQYLPLRQAQGGAYGEDYIYQRNSSWNVPYTFSGKEKDSETGYSYFGARYYSSEESIWLSVVPIAIGTLADKYPSMSAYMYVAGNPVMLVDPDGMAPRSPFKIFKGNPVMMKALYDAAQSGIYQRYINNGNPVFMTVNYNGEEQRVFTINGGDASKPAVNIYNNVSLNGIGTNHTIGGESPMIQTVAAKTVDAIPIAMDAPEMKLIPMPVLGANSNVVTNSRNIINNPFTGVRPVNLNVPFQGGSANYRGNGNVSLNTITTLATQIINNPSMSTTITIGTDYSQNNQTGVNLVNTRTNKIRTDLNFAIARQGGNPANYNILYDSQFSQRDKNGNRTQNTTVLIR